LGWKTKVACAAALLLYKMLVYVDLIPLRLLVQATGTLNEKVGNYEKDIYNHLHTLVAQAKETLRHHNELQ